MTDYYAYYRDATGATWTEETRYLTHKEEREVNKRSTLVVLLRSHAGSAPDTWVPDYPRIGRHLLLTSATFSGSAGSATLFHGQVRDLPQYGDPGNMALLAFDWGVQLDDAITRTSTRQPLRQRSGYAVYDYERRTTSCVNATITDATVNAGSPDKVSNALFNSAYALVFNPRADASRNRTVLAVYPAFGLDDWYNGVTHVAGSVLNVGTSTTWTNTAGWHTSSYVVQDQTTTSDAIVATRFACPFRSLLELEVFTVGFGAYIEGSAATAAVSEVYNHSTAAWDSFTGTVDDGGGAGAHAGNYTVKGYYDTWKTFNGTSDYVDDDGVVITRIKTTIPSAYLALDYARLTVYSSTPHYEPIKGFFKLTGNSTITNSTVHYVVSVVADERGVRFGGNDWYSIVHRTDAFIATLVAQSDDEVTLSTANIAQNYTRQQYIGRDWVGVSKWRIVTDLARYDRTNTFVDPTDDSLHYNVNPLANTATIVTINASTQKLRVLEHHYDFHQLYTRAKVYGHAYDKDRTTSGHPLRCVVRVIDPLAESRYNMVREWSYTDSGVTDYEAAYQLATRWLGTHNQPRLRVRIQLPGRYTSVQLNDVCRLTMSHHNTDQIMYCWMWQYDQQKDETVLSLAGPADSLSSLRPDAVAAELEELRIANQWAESIQARDTYTGGSAVGGVYTEET